MNGLIEREYKRGSLNMFVKFQFVLVLILMSFVSNAQSVTITSGLQLAILEAISKASGFVKNADGTVSAPDGAIWGPITPGSNAQGFPRHDQAIGICKLAGASLPSVEVFRVLLKQLGHPANYNPAPIDGLSSGWFWTSTVSSPYVSIVNGSTGKESAQTQDAFFNVICVRLPAPPQPPVDNSKEKISAVGVKFERVLIHEVQKLGAVASQFGEGWRDPRGVIWSNNGSATVRVEDVLVYCSDIGGEIPTVRDFLNLADYLGPNGKDVTLGQGSKEYDYYWTNRIKTKYDESYKRTNVESASVYNVKDKSIVVGDYFHPVGIRCVINPSKN